MTRARPPRLARWLASLLVRPEARDVVLGDLDEELARAIEAGVAPPRAKRRYWRQALASIAVCGRWSRAGLASPPRSRSAAAYAGLANDVRHAARVLARTPGFTAVAVASLAIGIGANTTVYSVIRALLFVPLPVDRPHELSLVYWGGPRKSPVRVNQINSSQWQEPSTRRYYSSNYTYGMFAALREAAGPSAEMFAFNFMGQATISIDDQAPVVGSGLLASAGYFPTMRVGVAMGRALGDHDDRPDAPPVVVVSHDLWTRRLGGSPDVVGRVIRVNGVACEIVGVTARGYRGLSPGGFLPATDVTLPLAAQPRVMARWNASPAAGASMFTSNLFWVRIVARLRAPPDELEPRLAGALRQEYAALPGAAGLDLSPVVVRLLPGARGLDATRVDADAPLQLLAGMAAIVLVMACLNLSALLLARGAARDRELSVRRALGASRARVATGLLVESLLVAAMGGAAGVLLAIWAGPLVSSMLTIGFGAADVHLGVNWALLGITAAVTLVAALLSGLIPAVRLSAGGAAPLAQRGDAAIGRVGTGRALIALQIAVSVPLLVGAGLLLRTLANFNGRDLGFDPEGLVVFRVEPRLAGATAERNPLPLYDRVLESVASLPGITAAALVEHALVSGSTSNTDVFLDDRRVEMSMNAVGPGFFETMGVPIVAGRAIGAGDHAGAPPVVVINETAAARFFPGTSPLGRQLMVGRRRVEIVGVAGAALYRDLRTPSEAMFYDSYRQRSFENMPGLAALLPSPVPSPMHVVLRTSGATAALRDALPSAVRGAAPELPITGLRTHVEQIEQTIAHERMFARLLAFFGAFAMLLASIGLHGVTAYAVARGTSEIGIRLALGAQRRQVVWMVIRQVAAVAAAGIALGVPIAVTAGPALGSLLFDVAPRDGVTIAIASLVMLSVAILAGWLPATRAARLPILAALRRE
jgi:predicted permease